MTLATCPAPTALRCEYFINPIGIDEAQPRLSWRLADARRGARQTAYEIACATAPDKLDSADVWTSGRVESDRTAHVAYAGPTLRSGQRVWWRVRVWDHEGQASPWCEAAFWEMGLLQQSDWVGRWIAAPLVGGPRTSIPCPHLRRLFRLDKPVASARLYVTALGLYEASINGRRIGEDVFTPGWTDYRKRVQYQTYDVTDQLQQGDNVIGAILGDGWCCGHVCWAGRQNWRDRPALLAQLAVTHADGSTTSVISDDAWRCAFGPILESDMLMGESYDARLEMPGWNAPAPGNGFDDAAWHAVVAVDPPDAPLVASASPRVRRVMELRPVGEGKVGQNWQRRHVTFDLGQNIAGRVRLRVRGGAGQTLTIRHAEMLNDDGSLYTANLREARATDHYTCRGDGVEEYEPHFTFHGFRYVEVSTRGAPFNVEDLVGVVLMSDTPSTGTFECSDPLVNQLQRNIQWGQRGNFLEAPTDCPQRNERLGWTGDAQIFVPTACFNADVAGFFSKWTVDLADAQAPSGSYPSVAPNRGFSTDDGGPAWAEAGVICPWTIYTNYGDTRLLQRHYSSMTRFIAQLDATSRDGGIRPHGQGVYEGFGDWLAIDAPHPGAAPTPKQLIGTAYFARAADLMARIAVVLGHRSDADRFAALRDRVKQAFCREFVTPAGRVLGNTQTGYLLALAFDLLPEGLRDAAVNHLVETVERANWHLTTGFVGTPLLCETLTRFGRHDVAWRVFRQETYPGWLYSVLQGATTMWERWNSYTRDKGFGDAGMNSFNHYAYGSIGRWLYGSIAGLEVDLSQAGAQRIGLAPRPPRPDAQGRALTHARAALDSILGRIECGWRVEGDALHVEVLVPPNAQASLQLPSKAIGHDAGDVAWRDDGRACDLPAGRYRFTCRPA